MIVQVRTLRFGELSVDCEAITKVKCRSTRVVTQIKHKQYALLSLKDLTGVLAEGRNR